MISVKKNKSELIIFRSKVNFILTGFILGILFPMLTWSFYLFSDKYSFSLSGISKFHVENPFNFIIDLLPVVLSLIFYLIFEKIIDEKVKLRKEISEKDKIIEQYSIIAKQIGEKDITVDDIEKPEEDFLTDKKDEINQNWIAGGKEIITDIIRKHNTLNELTYDVLVNLINYTDFSVKGTISLLR